MKKVIDFIKSFPWWGYVFAAGTIGLQVLIYFITGQINGARAGSFNAIDVKIPVIDDAIPFIVNSSIFYFASYPYWFIAALAVSKCGKEHVVNLAIGYAICIFIGLFFFVFMPTYLDREAEGVYQAVQSPGATNALLRFIYDNDGGKIGVNLFPSFHCLVTTYWCLAALGRKELRRGYKGFTIIAVVLICTCTLTTKQHYFLDVIGGIGFAVVIFFLIKLINPSKYIFKEKAVQR